MDGEIVQEIEAPVGAHLAAFGNDCPPGDNRERVRLQDLARTLGYSASHVSAVIHRTTGRRFTQLRRDMQLEHAMFLLRRGVPVKRSALDAGFNDPAYFSRVFSRRFGVPPSRWRQLAG